MNRSTYSSNKHDGSSKSQKKFVAKSQNPTPTDLNSNPKPKPTSLSSSLRQADSTAMSSNSAVASGSSRIRMSDNGDWVPNRRLSQSSGNFVNYLPQDEAIAAGLDGLDPVESQRVVDLLNRELARLLKLNGREFWREVASDASLHEFLDSFLQFRSRWYDFPYHGAKGIVAGVIVGDLDLNRRVFMVLYRISCNRDPGAQAADSLSPKDHAALLQDRKLLDLPKILDICAIYGHENEELTKSLVENAVKAQPWIHDSFSSVLSHFLGIVHTMHQRCTSSLEALFSSGRKEEHVSSRLCTELLEVMDFINDGAVSFNALVAAYKPAAVYFSHLAETSYGNEDLLSTLARLHDSLLPSLEQGFQVLFTPGDAEISDIGQSLKLLSSRIVNFGWKLLDICYLSDEVFRDGISIPAVTKMFPARVEDPVIRTDILVQTFREISGVSEHAQEMPNRNRLLQRIEKNYQIMERFQSLQAAGWISMDDELFQYVAKILMHFPSAPSSKQQQAPVPSSVTNNKELMDEDTAVKESKISQIKDLFPDYGNGFLAACLEAYNQNPEEVIQRILEGTLHEDLQQLDTSLQTMPPPKSGSTLSGKDKGKGKGKLSETTNMPDNKSLAKYGEQQIGVPLVSSSSSASASSAPAGRFFRKSKEEVPDKAILDARNRNDAAKNAALLSQYEYEDEYDDSFDDLGMSVVESRLEETELFADRAGTTSKTESEGDGSKWGSRKKPQFYVKDGKNYSYKVSGSVAVANANEAELVNKTQGELIHGLGRGGNIPLGAAKKLMEYNEQQNKSDASDMEGREITRNQRTWGRGERGKQKEFSQEPADKTSETSEVKGNGEAGSHRGRGRGRGRGGGRDHYRKDRAMKKHFAGLTGF